MLATTNVLLFRLVVRSNHLFFSQVVAVSSFSSFVALSTALRYIQINPFPVITIPRMKQLLFSIYHQPANNCFSLTAPTHGTISVGTKNTLKQRGVASYGKMAAATGHIPQNFNAGRWSSWRALWVSAGGSLADASLGIAMRVPGLFIIDYWWQFERTRALPQTLENTAVMQALLNNVVLIHGFFLLLLPIEHLRTLYSHLLLGVLLFMSHFVSERYVIMEMHKEMNRGRGPSFSENLLFLHAPLDSSRHGSSVFSLAAVVNSSCHFITLLCHLAISMAVFSFLERPSRSLQILLCVHMLPVFARLANLPFETLPVLQAFGDSLLCLSVLYYICYKFSSLVERVKKIYTDAVATGHHGIDTMHLLSLLWSKLFVPTHFVVFWALSFCGKVAEGLQANSNYSPRPLMFLLQCASAVCCSPINLLATSMVVSYLSNLIIRGSRLFLEAEHEDNPMHSGWTQGLTLVLLGLQTGLMQMELPSRTLALLVILFVVASSLLQNILEITEPVVLSLNASRSLTKWRHIKVLMMCAMLFGFPLLLTFKLASILPIDAWIVMVLSTCVLTSVQVLGMLSVHALFVYDGLHEQNVDLDDVLFMARAFTKLLELLISLFVIAASVYESSTSKWNLANSTILIVHSYCNVYQRIHTGWRSFLLRRRASMMIDLLATPSLEQLAAYRDVCPICYLWLPGGSSSKGTGENTSFNSSSSLSSSATSGQSTMAAAAACCITPCWHYFHRNCLKKWLYSQDACPMCHQKVISSVEGIADMGANGASQHQQQSSNNSPTINADNDHEVEEEDLRNQQSPVVSSENYQ
ncbi:RING finger protein 145-like isoform X2 [Varroa jacobsoni]|uniref:RING-type domain-containing protein n=1 Tax=Varroa destructor TaxID=109461 RepID=A0A7M7KSB1_VARDE|nr:RING finger protein 145-like isoform X2 [Varroa destructor]XP_022697654.1 RING finger protein 145-like isoform X2 [Varroa jacobsoni]